MLTTMCHVVTYMYSAMIALWACIDNNYVHSSKCQKL